MKVSNMAPKTPEVGSLGFSYSVWARWLKPLADYRYLSPSSHLQR